MEIVAVGSELFHVDAQMDGQTQVTKLFAILRTYLTTTYCCLLHYGVALLDSTIREWRTVVETAESREIQTQLWETSGSFHPDHE
jgi:hypothetical protein